MKLSIRVFHAMLIALLLAIAVVVMIFQGLSQSVSQELPVAEIANEPEGKHHSVNLSASDVVTSPSMLKARDPEKKTAQQAAAAVISKTNDLLSKEDALEMIIWQQARGYPSFSSDGELEESQYNYYDDQTLEDLGRGGDPEAMLVLARRNFHESGNYERARSLFYEASVHGYTVSLAELGNLAISKANQNVKQNNTEEVKKYFKDAYAWFETGIMRGDKTIEFSKAAYNVEFSGEELDEIMLTAQEYYRDLSRKRADLGYPPFDNDYPVGLDILYGQMFSN